MTTPRKLPQLHVATYNIHKGFTQFNRRVMVHELRDCLRELAPDVVFLQEVQGLHRGHAKKLEDWPEEPQHKFLAEDVWQATAYGRNMPISLILMLFLGVATAFALALEGQSRAWLWPLVSAGLSVSVHALLSLRFRLRRSGEAHGSWQAISALSLGFQGLAWSALAWLPLGLTPPTQMLLALGIASCLALINAFPLFGCAPAYTAFMKIPR